MESNEDSFNLIIFTKKTKTICLCTATSIFIIVAFIITPLSNFYKTSIIMKSSALIIMAYVIYLNYSQTELLRSASLIADTEETKSQLNKNIICSYIFTLFIGLLFIFVLKSFF
jgi:purine-cytosine permease-like protein